MAKPRGKYDKSTKIEQSDQDRADHYVELLNKELAVSSNLKAIVNALRDEKPEIQKRVISALLPPKTGRPGRPKRKMPDEITLDHIETWKNVLAEGKKTKVSDRAAVKYALENGFLRMGRREGTPFNPASAAGRQEMERVIAALGRARKAKKSKIPRG